MLLFIGHAIFWLKDNWAIFITPIFGICISIILIFFTKECESYIAKNQRLEIENKTQEISHKIQVKITNNFETEANQKDVIERIVEVKKISVSKNFLLSELHQISNTIACEFNNFDNLDYECK